jgi:LPXTG-motif cell wall-anchored protein
MRIIRKILLVVTLFGAVVLGGATAAQALTYGGGTITAPPTVVPGGQLVLSGTGFPPNTPITITIDPGGTVITGVVTDANGNYTTTITAPTGAGTYTITASGGGVTTSTTITVAASGPVLPNTGSSSPMKLAPVGAGFVALGALIVFGVRSRNRRDSKVDTFV